MGNTNSNNYKLSFEDMEWITHHYPKIAHKLIIIHTLDNNEEDVLIKYTTLANDEDDKINKFMKSDNKDIHICIYGKNAHDTKIHDKYNQLKDLGFVHVYVYIGGLFEWLLLQQLYGEDTYKIFIHPNTLLKYNWREDTYNKFNPNPNSNSNPNHFHTYEFNESFNHEHEHEHEYEYELRTEHEHDTNRNILATTNKLNNILFNYMLKYKPISNPHLNLNVLLS